MSPDARPDRHALLELQALLTQIAALRSEGNADRFTADARYRWILHLSVPRSASTALTSKVARPAFRRDDHRSCACGSCSS